MDYWTEDERNLITEWYDAQDVPVQVAFDFALMEILGTDELKTSKRFKRMRRQHMGLWEVRLVVGEGPRKRNFRPVGFWDYGEHDFILVDACLKSGQFTIPPGVFDAASDILGQFFHEGRGTAREHQL